MTESSASSSGEDVIENVIIGGGPGGLYTAWRLATQLADGTGKAIGPIHVFEWGDRLGGRIFTKHFDSGQFVELGGMRFSTGHKLVNKTIDDLQLSDQKQEFPMVKDRLFYLRGKHFYGNEIPPEGVPYRTRKPDDAHTSSDAIFLRVTETVAPGSTNYSRKDWCKYFDSGRFPAGLPSDTYKENDLVGNIGYWNLMYDQLGSETFQYAADAGGYTSNIINWNAANALPYNGEFGANDQYYSLKGGYTTLINALQTAATANGAVITRGMRLWSFTWNDEHEYFDCHFQVYANGAFTGKTKNVKAKRLFLCMPRNGLELIANNSSEGHVLKETPVKYYIESVIEQPSYKIALLFDQEWWKNATYKPKIYVNGEQTTVGPTITDIPLRQIYYFGNNASPDRPKFYGLLASYDDMWFTDFWKSLEIRIGSRENGPDSEDLQPLSEGTQVPDRMIAMLKEQLRQVHSNDQDNLEIPDPVQAVFIDWGRNPFGAGYHAWKSHYALSEAMDKVRAPYKAANATDKTPLYVIGSAYSNDQAWIEGAFCTADSVLRDFLQIEPLIGTDPDYPLICSDCHD